MQNSSKAGPPRQPSEITLAWLDAVVHRQIGTHVASISVEPLNAGFYGTSSRINATYPADESGPASLVAKFSAPDAQTRRRLSRMHIYEREVNFYTRLASRSPVRVPHCYFADFDPDTCESTILMEFSDGISRSEIEGPTFEQAKMAMQAAARLHKHWRGDRVLEASWIHRLVDAEFLDGMLDGTSGAAPLAVQRLQGLAPDWLLDSAPRAADIIGQQLRALDALPHTLIHFDFRVANMFFFSEPGDLTLIDWQSCLRGPGVCDVAMFASVSLPIERRRAWEHELVRCYLTEVEDRDVAVWPAWFEEAWCRIPIFLAANMIRNAEILDLSNEDTRTFVGEYLARMDAVIEDHQAFRYID